MKAWVRGALLAAVIAVVTAWLGIHALLQSIERSKCKRLLADVESVRTAIEQYKVDVGVYPVAMREQQTRAALEPKYLRRMPDWIDYFSDARSYAIFSHWPSTTCWFELRDGHYVSWPAHLDAAVKALEASRGR